jgi:ParB family transcriptional regulator, chromosome partitioning protein
MATAILPAAAISASDPMPINRPAENVRDISLSAIDPPTFNPRRFDQADLDQLAESLADCPTGQLQPVIVRKRGKRFQIVAGERRYRAALQAGLKTLTCTVRELDDKQAAELQMVDNVQRRELDAIELAVGFKVLCDLGHTAESLAGLVGAEERVINNRLALLSLPDDWQRRIREGKLTAAQAEYVLPFADRPEVLDALRTVPATELPLCEWKHRIVSAAMAVSRSMDPESPDGPQFALSADNLRRLDVVTVEIQPGKTVKRAFACAIWDCLQDDAERHGPEPVPFHAGNGRANGKAPVAAARKAVSPSQGNFGEPVLLGAEADQADFNRRLREWMVAYLRRLCTDVINSATPFQLPALAALLGVDVEANWRMKRDFVELFAGERLEALAADLRANVEMCRDDRERIAVLLALSPKAVPTVFREALAEAAKDPAGSAA